jgi:signal transduction histidine kinase/ligand-binding sensor domain-containing protein
MKKFLLLVLLLVGIKHTHAQSSHLKFDHFTVKDGLPERQVRFIKQDNLGYIWVGTQNGLLRYDGYKPKVYRFGVDKDSFYQTCSAESMIIDNDNTLWVTTFGNGLFRYDRSADKFIQYKYQQQPGKKTTLVQVLSTTDSSNNLWSFNRTFPQTHIELIKFNQAKQQFEYFNRDQKGAHHFEPRDCYYICKTSNGTIWLGTSDGLYVYDQAADQYKLYPLESIRHDTISRIYEAPSEKGILWLNSTGKQSKKRVIVRLNTRTKTAQYFSHDTDPRLNKSNDTINTSFEDSKHRLWFATPKGLLFFDRRTAEFTNYLTTDTAKIADKDEVHTISEAKDGTLWLTAATGILNFDPETKHFQRYRETKDDPTSLNGESVSSLLIDRFGSLFVVARGEGLNKNNPLTSAFITYNQDKNNLHGYPGGETSEIISTNDGYVLFTNPNGVYKWKPGSDNFEQVFKPAKSSDYAYGVTYGDKNLLYFLTGERGFQEYNTETHQLHAFVHNPKDSTSISSNSLAKIMRDHLGIIWIGTDDQGVCSFDPATRKFTRYPFILNNGSLASGDKLDDRQVISLFEDRDNTLWIGTNLGGLNHFDRKTGKFKSYLTDGKMRAFSVVSICQGKDGMLWLGTYLNGVFEFDPKTGHFIKNINEDNGLLFNSINAINEDSQGNVWVSSERGLSRINPKDMSVKNFPMGIFTGKMANSHVNNIPRVGDLLVMDIYESIAYFNPNDLTANPYPPAVHIEKIGYSDPRTATDSATTLQTYGNHGIELPHNQNRITFSYVALHFADPSQNKYSYILKGYDTHWVQAGTQRSVTYTNLAPGTYTFRVRASNSDGVWNNEGDSFLVIVDSPLWLRWWAWAIYIVLFGTAIYGFIAYRSLQLKMENQELEQKIGERTKQLSNANTELSEKQEEIITQRDRLAETVTELKTTQQQLVQSEKLASLGELTAGIAHEIQNPLNFVNNFAEVSAEMVDELADELKNEKRDQQLEEELLSDLKQNLEKITHHGKRADGIVKNMLQHSRANTGERQPTDINTLADEYLRLAYHGLRAKDKDFNSATVTNLASDLPKINVIPQDIGRVLLNLFNNAFYAVHLKQQTAGTEYKPEVTVTTYSEKGGVVIIVKDNGNGIPDNIKDKIMQPFFTTKPTGEGTGLGLSLSYDIVVKGHGGDIKVNTKESEFTEFIIYLPI